METRIVVTGILKDKDLFLVVRRSKEDDLYPGCWEFPGGHIEFGETISDALKRELKEEIGFSDFDNPIITNYTDEVKEKSGKTIHNIELDFIIEANKENINITLSKEHTEYAWVPKESELLDDYIKAKLLNLQP
ncbi:MAG: NUDIX domain-containing protein [Bacilli bacterium]|nr:NUDIX domain-containing protein [Mycoplasmatota bacterium]MDD6941336.1 NUDIX domain-containing protein [bacterium]MDY2697806.1 NUDIX domain-containing protein [Bacilli bacterium]MDY5993580.1 NUDIX domain-containing protein [Bacilli bacterium]MEE0014878.1 NUDIX domain-containing protein [Bacilli bacterium]